LTLESEYKFTEKAREYHCRSRTLAHFDTLSYIQFAPWCRRRKRRALGARFAGWRKGTRPANLDPLAEKRDRTGASAVPDKSSSSS